MDKCQYFFIFFISCQFHFAIIFCVFESKINFLEEIDCRYLILYNIVGHKIYEIEVNLILI